MYSLAETLTTEPISFGQTLKAKVRQLMAFRPYADLKLDQLKQVPLFRHLTRRQLELLSYHADVVRLKSEDVLARQGEYVLEFLLIAEGRARAERDGRVIALLCPGDTFGEVSLIDGQPQIATVIAETPVTLFVVHKRSFSDLLNKIPGLQWKLLKTLCERFRQCSLDT